LNSISIRDRHFSRREIIRYAFRLIFDSIQMIFAHTYVCITFLIIYGTMWSQNMHFDTRFFAVASCMLSYLEISVMDFAVAIRDIVHYVAAEKRIKVSLKDKSIHYFCSIDFSFT
jgi:hypothetical protein